MRRATRGGATATPSRCGAGASPRGEREHALASPPRSAGTARISPPSRRRLLMPSRLPVGVHERAARRAARERGGVLDGARDAAAARAAEAAARRTRRSRAWRAGRARRGWRARRTGVPMPGASRRLPARPAATSPVSTLEHREVEVGVDARDRAGLAPAVGERDGHLLAAEVVRAGEHLAVARSPRPSRAPQPRPRPTTDGPDPLGRPRDRVLQCLSDCAHAQPPE